MLSCQMKDTLGALADRFKALRVEGGGLHLSRLLPTHSRAVSLKRVVQYSPNWVKNQQRVKAPSPVALSCSSFSLHP